MKVVNLTPHAINLVGQDGTQIAVIPPSGNIARCTTNKTKVRLIELCGKEIEVFTTTFRGVTGLPDEEEGTFFIVSAIVAQAMKGDRYDLLIVDNTVRNEQGQIIGCTSFGII